jgi:uncharacterized membrane protein
MKNKNIFILNWKKFVGIVLIDLLSIILHNLVSGLLGVEEAFFFSIAVLIIPIYLLIAIVYSTVNYFKNKKKIEM